VPAAHVFIRVNGNSLSCDVYQARINQSTTSMHPASAVGKQQAAAQPRAFCAACISPCRVMLRRAVVTTASCARLAVEHRALMPAVAVGNTYRFVGCNGGADKTMTASDAAGLVRSGDTIAVSSRPPGSAPSAVVDARVSSLLGKLAKKIPNRPSAREELTRAFDIMQHHVVKGRVTVEGMAVAHKELGELAATCMGSPALAKAYIEARDRMREEAVKVPANTNFDRTLHAPRQVNRDAVIDWNVASQGGNRRIRLLGDPIVLRKMQERHVVLQAPGRTSTQIIGPSEIDVKERTLVLHGESGCGKTMAALSRAAGDGRACVYLVMNERIDSEFGTYKSSRIHFPSHKKTVARRNKAAFKLLESELERVLKCTNFSNPSCPLSKPQQDGDATVVLVIDELGGSDNHRQFLRALIARRTRIGECVQKRFKCREVQLVLCGSGIDTSTVQPGSRATEYRLHNPTADLTWRAITKFFQAKASLPGALVSAVEKQKSSQAGMAYDLVSNNGRAAALFLVHAQVLAKEGIKAETQPQGCVDALIEHCARQAAVGYKARNSLLANLDPAEHFTCVAAALRATWTSRLPETLCDSLLTKGGLLTDRLRCQCSAAAGTATYYLPSDCLGQRFAMSRSQVIIAELLANVSQRPAAGGAVGFARAFADHLRWILAGDWPKTLRRDYWSKNDLSFSDSPPPQWNPTAPQGPVAPPGWMTVGELAKAIWARPAGAAFVSCRKCELPVDPKQPLRNVDEMVQGLAACTDTIFVNADRSPFADLIVLGGLRSSVVDHSSVMLIRCMRCHTTSPGAPTVLEVLAKMGCVDASDVARDVADLHLDPSAERWAASVSYYLKSRGVTKCTTTNMPAVGWEAELVKRINNGGDARRLFIPDVKTRRARYTAELMRKCDVVVEAARKSFDAEPRNALWNSNVAQFVARGLTKATAGTELKLPDCTKRIETALASEPTFKWGSLDRALAAILKDTTGGTRALGLLRTLACATNWLHQGVRVEVVLVVYGQSPQPCDFLPPGVKLVYVPDDENDAATMQKVADSCRGLHPTRVPSPDDDANQLGVEVEYRHLENTQRR
jgi:hypothetical protein